MLKVGLTGNIGSGKSTVADIFKNLGIQVYDADSNAKKFLNDNGVKNKIKEYYGEKVFGKANEVNKKRLAEIVFNDADALIKLNSIIHPFVIDDFIRWSQTKSDESYIILEAAILFESGYSRTADKIITVTCPENIRIERIMQRDNATKEQVLQRMKNQWMEEDKVKMSDYIIINDGSHQLIPQVMKLNEKLRQKDK